MTFFLDLNTYLHQSSLLIQAYPTTRISTKYSLPRKAKPESRAKSKKAQAQPPPSDNPTPADPAAEKRAPSAILTLKTFHPESGTCLKYQTDKAAEVGRLMTGLGRLAAGEVIEMPTIAPAGAVDSGERMDVDGTETLEPAMAKPEEVKNQVSGGGGGKSKKKRGKK